MEHMKLGVERGFKFITEFSKMTSDEVWLRPVKEQVDGEVEYYKEQLQLIREDIENYGSDTPLIVEGAAILPEFMEDMNIANHRVIYIVPTAEFQLEHYKKREWVKDVLMDCSNPEKAFENWMNRDIEYAKRVLGLAKKYNRNHILVDGKESLEENFQRVEGYFQLDAVKE